MSSQSIDNWRCQERVVAGLIAGVTSTKRAELIAARRRIAQLEPELAVARRDAEPVARRCPQEAFRGHRGDRDERLELARRDGAVDRDPGRNPHREGATGGMQNVVGSSPIIRSGKPPQAGVSCCRRGSCHDRPIAARTSPVRAFSSSTRSRTNVESNTA